MVYDDQLPELIRPNVQTIGYEHEWALSLFDIIFLFFEYDALNNDPTKEVDPNACQKIAIDLLKRIPAWKLHWNEDHDALDEVSRQLQLQICILGRTLLFIAKQIPHAAREHALLASLHITLFTLSPPDYMPDRFSSSPRLRQWVTYWLTNPLTNKSSPDPDHPPPPTPLLNQGLSSLHTDHLPSRNIWLFDQYLSSAEHANLMALTARISRSTHDPLLQLDAQSTIERTLCHAHPGPILDKTVPGAATWFLYAFPDVPAHHHKKDAQPDLLKGWYEVYMPSGNGTRLTPHEWNAERYEALGSEEAKWWAFFKDRFREVGVAEGVKPLTREYALEAVRKMDWLDGSEKVGFWEGLRRGFGGRRKEAKL